MNLQEKLDLVPRQPGVYLMKDKQGRIIYVGKAKNLRSRVRSYFQPSAAHGSKTALLVKNIADLEYIVTDSEVEALVLESNLIKKHKPKYNIRIRDDKHYPYIKVTTNELFPRLLIARRIKKDGAKYYGPYPDASAARSTIKLLNKIFQLRSCKQSLSGENAGRPCLNYHIKRCTAPCQGHISPEQYQKTIDNVCRFLEGRHDEIVAMLNKQMEEAAAKLQFEEAAKLRDQLQSVEAVLKKQKVISAGLEDMDVIAMARGIEDTCVSVFFMRRGRIVGRENFFISGSEDSSRGEVLAAFIKQYYANASFIPKEILLDDSISDSEVIAEWLSEKRGSRVYLKTPQRGQKRKLCEMAHKNAMAAVEERWAKRLDRQELLQLAVEELAFYLKLPQTPKRIECYDISNIQGALSVGSMVVFRDGRPCNSHYRRFRIKTVEGPNDFASMQEVLRRRIQRIDSDDESFSEVPELIIIDGGKGQLSAAREVLEQEGYAHLAVVGLAKREEHLFLPDRPDPVVLPRNSQSLYLVQRIRDEAHRFAVSYHRRLRSQRQVATRLEQVPGIGPVRRTNLLKHFGSFKKIQQASVDELARVPGMTRTAAETLHQFLHTPKNSRKVKEI